MLFMGNQKELSKLVASFTILTSTYFIEIHKKRKALGEKQHLLWFLCLENGYQFKNWHGSLMKYIYILSYNLFMLAVKMRIVAFICITYIYFIKS